MVYFSKGMNWQGSLNIPILGGWNKNPSWWSFSYVIYPFFSDMVWVGSHIMTPDCCPRHQELCRFLMTWKETLKGAWIPEWLMVKRDDLLALSVALAFYFKGSRGWKDLKREVSPRDWIVLVKWHTYLREPSWKLMHFSCVDRTFQSQVAASKSVWSVAVTETIALCLNWCIKVHLYLHQGMMHG